MQVAAALWALLLREAALPRHLEAVKDYFLLGAGNVFQTFLQEARTVVDQFGHRLMLAISSAVS